MAELTKSEQYISSESPEINLGEHKGWTKNFYKIFPALSNRNYQFYFIGQLISLIGTWLQIVAQGWLVLKLTNSVFLIGLVAAVASLPTLLFSLFGGVIVDKFSKKKILVFTHIASMILAFILGLLTVFNIITLEAIIILAFLLGVVAAIDMPARQAFVIDIVGRKDLPSAISLNSGIFNGARVIGPAVAGFLIASVGIGGAFIVNGFTYIAAIAALLIMKVVSVNHESHLNPLLAIKEGIIYSYKHSVIRILLIFVGIVSIFGWSLGTILPYIAEHTFHTDAIGLSYLYVATGLGALTSAIIVSALSKKISPFTFILGGNVIFAIGTFLFSLTSNLTIATIFLFLSGFGLLAQLSMMNTVIQSLVEDKFRGRVMSIYTVMFLGLSLLGNLQIGFFSQHFGTGFAIRLGAFITLLFGILIYINKKEFNNNKYT